MPSFDKLAVEVVFKGIFDFFIYFLYAIYESLFKSIILGSKPD
jgi:hypothetical protein